MKYVVLQLLLIWHLLRSLASAAHHSCSAHKLRWLPQDGGVGDAAVLQAGMSELAALCDWVTVSGLSDAA